MRLKGISIKLGNNINTDLIISGRYKFAITDIKELAKHIMEDIDPHFSLKIKRGKSIIAAGKNFGLGSSREQAPLVIKEAGIITVVAKSFARIFYRNGINIGLPLLEADTDLIDEGDMLNIDLEKGYINNDTKNIKIKIKLLPKIMRTILTNGGIVAHFKKYGKFNL